MIDNNLALAIVPALPQPGSDRQDGTAGSLRGFAGVGDGNRQESFTDTLQKVQGDSNDQANIPERAEKPQSKSQDRKEDRKSAAQKNDQDNDAPPPADNDAPAKEAPKQMQKSDKKSDDAPAATETDGAETPEAAGDKKDDAQNGPFGGLLMSLLALADFFAKLKQQFCGSSVAAAGAAQAQAVDVTLQVTTQTTSEVTVGAAPVATDSALLAGLNALQEQLTAVDAGLDAKITSVQQKIDDANAVGNKGLATALTRLLNLLTNVDQRSESFAAKVQELIGKLTPAEQQAASAPVIATAAPVAAVVIEDAPEPQAAPSVSLGDQAVQNIADHIAGKKKEKDARNADASKQVDANAPKTQAAPATSSTTQAADAPAPLPQDEAASAALLTTQFNTAQDDGHADRDTSANTGLSSTTASNTAIKPADTAPVPFARVLAQTQQTAATSPAEQVVAHVKTAIRGGDTRIQVQLSPADLGNIEIRMDVSSDGKTKLSITADNTRAFDMLKNDARALEHMLRDVGLKTDSGSLSFNLRGDGNQQNLSREQGGRQGHAYRGQTIDALEDALEQATTQSVLLQSADGLDIRI